MTSSVQPESVIYLAGGCFWGMEKAMRSITGVIDVTCGYANGTGEADATYETVCTGRTGFRETVRVDYDPKQVSLDDLLRAFLYVIDPTARDRQGNDVGTQYQSGIYYVDDASAQEVGRIVARERARTPGFAVEVGPLRNFFPAEEYHQRYLDKNPQGYCHISPERIAELSRMPCGRALQGQPSEDDLCERLTPEQYAVTQEAATERPFSSPYWDSDERGVYVDVVSGEPLFSSEDKYVSSCGWPAFTAPIVDPLVVRRNDSSHGMFRTEVRSWSADSHLGHVFQNDPESPTGTRYCIDGAALRFVPYENLEREGYGDLRALFD